MSDRRTAFETLARALLTITLALGLACGGGDDETPAEEETSGGEELDMNEHASQDLDDPHSTSEAEAVSIALSLAEAEGHDTSTYSDVVVHSNESNQWEVSLRRPMRTRFLMVTVDKSTGHAELNVMATGH